MHLYSPLSEGWTLLIRRDPLEYWCHRPPSIREIGTKVPLHDYIVTGVKVHRCVGCRVCGGWNGCVGGMWSV